MGSIWSQMCGVAPLDVDEMKQKIGSEYKFWAAAICFLMPDLMAENDNVLARNNILF